MKCIKIFAISFLIGGLFVSFSEAAPRAVYIDTTYTVGSAGGHSFGVDAFANIQAGINAVASGGAVFVAAGVYDEQVVIDAKTLTLQGTGDTTIIQPSGPGTVTSLYVYPGGAPLWPGITVAGIILVRNTSAPGATIIDLKVDGTNIAVLPAGAERLTGILYGESGGTIQNVTVNNIKTNGATDRTYGIDAIAIGSPVSVDITDNRITDFLRNGIQAIGENLTVNILNNTITGPANSRQIINGIALIYGLRGKVSGNIVNRIHSPNDEWRSSGIILYGDGLRSMVIEGNEVFDADYGISVSTGANDSTIKENYLHGNKTGVMFESGAAGNTVVSNNITGNLQGIQIHGSLNSNETGNKPPGTGNTASNNTIAGNEFGIISFDDTQTFDVKDNWWGSPDPDFTRLIIGSVAYTPWLTAANSVPSSAIKVPTVSRRVEMPPPPSPVVPEKIPEEVIPPPEEMKDEPVSEEVPEVILPGPSEEKGKPEDKDKSKDEEEPDTLFDVFVEPKVGEVPPRPIFLIFVSIVLGILLALSLAFGIPRLRRWWKKRAREKGSESRR